ncbi:ABC transporter substrate-binding protein [Microlunatus speluncae]|uniref:ABC transporter substrate-binding protein n=1 Tax=Microlunatus speluncae TaxID=2594267 RepID=UPI0012664705|nr:extracellular solute-binding protein [Microlunatus speluncae]
MINSLSRRGFLSLAGAAAVVPAVTACTPGNGNSTSASSKEPITFWSGFPTTDSNDKSKKPADFWINQAIGRFTAKTGVEVKVEELPGDATMFTKIRTASIGGKGPDVASVWSGSYMLSVGDFLEPMRQYFDDTEFAALSGWPAVTEGFDPTQGDKILGVPNGTDGAMALLFNAEQLDRAGVDPAGWPNEFDTWIGELDKIKTSGVTPLTLGKLNYLYFTYDTWLAQAAGGPPGIGELSSGAKKFTDPAIVDATTKWLRLRDYTVPGAPTIEDTQASQQLFNGKAAMSVGGAGGVRQLRKKLGDKSGAGKLPTISATAIQGGTVGGCGNAFIVSKNSKRKEQSVELIKHLLSAEEQRTFAESGDPGPLVGRTDLSDLYPDPLVNQLQAWGVEASNTFWPDNTFPADLVSELGAQAQLAWNGDIGAEEFLAKLDAKRDSLQ